MREIKFRAQDIASNKWLFGDIRHHKNDVCIFEQGGNKGELVKPETVGQFTGLTDKNGKEIYEGDIIRVKEYDNTIMNDFDDDPNRFELFTLDEICGNLRNEFVKPIEVKEINFSCDEFYLDCFYGDMRRSSPIFVIEVVGNVFDNPDLIEKGGEQDGNVAETVD